MARSEKTKPHWVAMGVLKFACPRCHREAVYEQVDVSKMILDGNVDDDFDIIFSGNDGATRDFLWPQHVCRNHTCDLVGTVKLPPQEV